MFATNIMMYNEQKFHERLERISMNPMYIV